MGGYRFDWGLVGDRMGDLLGGYAILLQVAAAGFGLAALAGILIAAAARSESVLIALPARAWVEVLRGIPVFLLLLLVYYGLPQITPVVLGPFTAAVLTFAVTGSAYAAEIYRGAFKAVDVGQWEAAAALGLSGWRRLRHVIAPQAVRVAVPPLVNLLVGLLKGATFVSVIGVADMFYVSRDISLQFFAPFEAYTFSGAVVVATTMVIAGLAVLLERRLAPGSGRT